nr:pectin acetylesterase 8-like [Ipomoea batatas]
MASAKQLACFFYPLICFSIALACSNDHIANVSRTLLYNAKGAVCLDGSPPAYYLDEGEGQGSNNWLIFLEGGGWCFTAQDCLDRSKSKLGTSTLTDPTMDFGNILTKYTNWNPEFCSWNRVYIHYCDGSSFTGDVESVTNNVTYRGARIFNAVVEDLRRRGMNNAQNAILAGSSAGGLAAILHCDRFRSVLPEAARVKCLADSAIFIHDEYSIVGNKTFDRVFQGLIDLHGSAPMLPASCSAKVSRPFLCFFPQYILKNIATPVFIVMSAFDRVQIQYDLSFEHFDCLVNKTCSLVEMTAIQELRLELLDALPTTSSPSFRGIWLTSCITHDVTEFSWVASKMMRIDNKTYPQAFADWFYDRSAIQAIDFSTEAKNLSARDAPSHAPLDDYDTPLDDEMKAVWISNCVMVTMNMDYGFYGFTYPFPADEKRKIEEGCTALANQ